MQWCLWKYARTVWPFFLNSKEWITNSRRTTCVSHRDENQVSVVGAKVLKICTQYYSIILLYFYFWENGYQTQKSWIRISLNWESGTHSSCKSLWRYAQTIIFFIFLLFLIQKNEYQTQETAPTYLSEMRIRFA